VSKYTLSPIQRNRLPNRRGSVSFDLTVGGLRYTATLSRYADGRIGEVFLNNHLTNSTADQLAGDSAIVFSIAVQSGADPEVIRLALGRDSQGRATSPLGTALDIIATAPSTSELAA
jgi:ribonucleoside-diphosphate reductase alpha chain